MPKGDVVTEVGRLEAAINDMEFPVVFCHNDATTMNIVYGQEEGLAFCLSV